MLEGEVIRIVGKAVVKGTGHAITRTLSVLAVIGVAWAIYIMAIKPHVNPNPTSTTNQQAKQIINQHITLQEDNCWVKMFGVKAFCFKNKKVYEVIKQIGAIDKQIGKNVD